MKQHFFLREMDEAIKLSEPAEGGAREYKIFPKKKLFHPSSENPVSFDDSFFAGMIESFVTRGLDVQVDFNHASAFAMSQAEGAAAGWITALAAKEDGLYATIEWTETGAAAIKAKEYRYLSPEWSSRQYDQNSGDTLGKPRLYAVALTNRPFLENQTKLAASESATKETPQMDQKEADELRAAKERAELAAKQNAEALAAVLKFQRDQMISQAMSEGRLVPAMVAEINSFADACGADLGKLKSFLDKFPKIVGEAAKGQAIEQKSAVDTSKLSESDRKAAKFWGHTQENMVRFGDYVGIELDPRTNKKRLVMADGSKVEV